MAPSDSDAVRRKRMADATRRYEESIPIRDSIERSRAESETGIVASPEDLIARAERLAVRGEIPISEVVQHAASEPEDKLESLERIIAAADSQSAGGAARAARVAQCVARLSLRDGGREMPLATGILVSRQLLLTNWHVLPDMDTAHRVIVEFDIEEDADGVTKQPKRFLLNPDAFLVGDESLDFALVLVRPDNDGRFAGEQFGWQALDRHGGKALVGESLNLIGHPYGRLKEMWTRDNQLDLVLEQFVHYSTAKGPANFGTPVFNDQWELVALHHAGVPRMDEDRRVLRKDGMPWQPGDGYDQIDWIAYEGVRVSAILQWLDAIAPSLPEPQRGLLAELGAAAGFARAPDSAPTPAAHSDSSDWLTDLAGTNPLVGQLIEEAQQRPEDFREAGDVRTRLSTLVAAKYAELDSPTAQLFRRTALVDSDGVDAGIAARLVGSARATASAMLHMLAGHGLLVERPDGRMYFVDDSIRVFADAELARTESEEERLALQHEVRRWISGRDHLPEPHLMRDFWTTDDELDHAPYANAIASFIQHEMTQPPLTIGIKAPWGAGKTSLMRMVQKRLDPSVGDDPFGTSQSTVRAPRPIQLDSTSRALLVQGSDIERKRSWWRSLVSRVRPISQAEQRPVSVREALEQAEEPEAVDVPIPRLRAEQRGDATGLDHKDWRATVWFNPWMYQSGEQIWAGLAHEIITQITARLPVGDRERFWLRLNLARMDRSAVRRRVYRSVLERLVPLLVTVVVGIGISCVVLLLGKLFGLRIPVAATGGIFAVGTAVGIVGSLVRVGRFFGQAAAGPLSGLVQGPDVAAGLGRNVKEEFRGALDLFPEPGYAPKSGLLYLVQTDMKRVLDLVATEKRPLVVFVDDLDRCTPGTVVQVIEAINLFLAGEFPNCVFVLAMEPRVVAAHIEVAYKDLDAALQVGHAHGDWATLGWRFLEKIIQLPLSLPGPQATCDLGSYARGLLQLRTAGSASEVSTVGAVEPGRAPEPSRGRAGETARQPAMKQPTPARQSTARNAPVHERTGTLDLELLRRLTAEIRGSVPTATTLPELARAAQQKLVPDSESASLLPETIAAVELIFKDLYRDSDAADAIEAALPSLAATTPREIKRYINLFRFYTFIAQRQRLDGRMAPSAEQIAKLAALAIRWPQMVSLIGQSVKDADHPLQLLEQSSRNETTAWVDTLSTVGLLSVQLDNPPAWCADLKTFLAADPKIGSLASRLL